MQVCGTDQRDGRTRAALVAADAAALRTGKTLNWALFLLRWPIPHCELPQKRKENSDNNNNRSFSDCTSSLRLATQTTPRVLVATFRWRSQVDTSFSQTLAQTDSLWADDKYFNEWNTGFRLFAAQIRVALYQFGSESSRIDLSGRGNSCLLRGFEAALDVAASASQSTVLFFNGQLDNDSLLSEQPPNWLFPANLSLGLKWSWSSLQRVINVSRRYTHKISNQTVVCCLCAVLHQQEQFFCLKKN